MIKNLIMPVLAGCLSLGSLSAATFVDTLTYGTSSGRVTTSYNIMWWTYPQIDVVGTFDLNKYAGFDLAQMHVESAAVTFWFRDDTVVLDYSQSVRISIAGDAFGGSIADSYLFNSVEVFPETQYSSTLGPSQIASTLNVDGKVSFNVTAVDGDFFITKAELTVVTAPLEVTNLPDGGMTSWLLGMGIMLLGGFRRKFQA